MGSVSLVWVVREEIDAMSSEIVRSGDGLGAAFDFKADIEKEKV